MNLVVIVEYMKLFEPSMLDGYGDKLILPIVEGVTPHLLAKLVEERMLQCKEWVTQRV